MYSLIYSRSECVKRSCSREINHSVIAFWLSPGHELHLSCSHFGTLALSTVIPFPYIQRYDAILLILLAVQYLMFRTGLETLDEIKVICVFHVIGLLLEIYKVHMGSWSYRSPHIAKYLAFRCTADLCTQV